MNTIVKNIDSLTVDNQNREFDEMSQIFLSLGTIIHSGEIQTVDGKNKANRLKVQFSDKFKNLVLDPNIAALSLDKLGILAEQNLSGESRFEHIKMIYTLINSYFNRIDGIVDNVKKKLNIELKPQSIWDEIGKLFGIDNLSLANCYQLFEEINFSDYPKNTLTKIFKRLKHFITSRESDDEGLNDFVRFVIKKIEEYKNTFWDEIGEMFAISNLSPSNWEEAFKNFSFDNYSKKKLEKCLLKFKAFIQEKKSDDNNLNKCVEMLISKISQALSKKLQSPMKLNVSGEVNIPAIWDEIGKMFGIENLDIKNCYEIFEGLPLETYAPSVLSKMLTRLMQISKSLKPQDSETGEDLNEAEELKIFVDSLIEKISEYLDDGTDDNSLHLLMLAREKKNVILRQSFVVGLGFFDEFVVWAQDYVNNNIALDEIKSFDDLTRDLIKYQSIVNFRKLVEDKYKELIYDRYEQLFDANESLEKKDYDYVLSQLSYLQEAYDPSKISRKATFFSLKNGAYLGDIYEFFNKLQKDLLPDLESKLSGVLLEGFKRYNRVE